MIANTHFATIRRGAFDPAYKWQLVGHIDCTGRNWVDFVSYCSDFPEEKQLIVHRIYREDISDEISRLHARRAEFLELVSEITKSLEESA